MFLVLRSMIITLVIVILMQVRIGNSTLEEKALVWIHEAAAITSIQDAVDGGVVLTREVWKKIAGSFSSKFLGMFSEDRMPGKRSLGLTFERSKKYLQERAEDLKMKREIEESQIAEMPEKEMETSSSFDIEDYVQ